MQQRIMDGRYVVWDVLGRGGMAEVYRAYDEVLERYVALKVLREPYAQDRVFVERFRYEARSVAALAHPNIVPVYDWGDSGGGTYYMAMEYLPGGTLKDFITGRGTLGPDTAADVALQIAGALGTAHQRGVIHRDVKSRNVLITASGDVKVADFGIARAASSTNTRTSLVVGTASHMSPEQALGETVGPASDLYSLGVVLYEMLTGKLPFTAENPIALAIKHIEEIPRPPREANPAVPKGLNALVVKLLEKKPENRYGDATELVEDLQKVLDGRPPATAAQKDRTGSGYLRPAGNRTAVARNAGRGRRYLRKLLPAGLLATGVLVGVIGWSIFQDRVDVPGSDGSPGIEASNTLASSPEFVHRATPENTSGNSTYLDRPSINGDPDAVLYVTQNWNPESDAGTYNDHPIGVWYDQTGSKWAIFNQDRARIPDGAAFNVVVAKQPAVNS